MYYLIMKKVLGKILGDPKGVTIIEELPHLPFGGPFVPSLYEGASGSGAP